MLIYIMANKGMEITAVRIKREQVKSEMTCCFNAIIGNDRISFTYRHSNITNTGNMTSTGHPVTPWDDSLGFKELFNKIENWLQKGNNFRLLENLRVNDKLILSDDGKISIEKYKNNIPINRANSFRQQIKQYKVKRQL